MSERIVIIDGNSLINRAYYAMQKPMITKDGIYTQGIRAVGMIILGFGIVQVGMSLKSHDPTQRANGIMTLAGGVVITFAKEILNIITGG